MLVPRSGPTSLTLASSNMFGQRTCGDFDVLPSRTNLPSLRRFLVADTYGVCSKLFVVG